MAEIVEAGRPLYFLSSHHRSGYDGRCPVVEINRRIEAPLSGKKGIDAEEDSCAFVENAKSKIVEIPCQR
jgi:hypothetical protein